MNDSSLPTVEDVWRDERLRHQRFDQALADLVAAAGPIWHSGDAYGGYVQMRIAQALNFAYGPLQEPPCDPKPYRRRKISGTVRNVVMERDQYRCVSCGSWEGLSLDHIHPLSKGGSDDPDNLQTMCRSCNSAKGARVSDAR